MKTKYFISSTLLLSIFFAFLLSCQSKKNKESKITQDFYTNMKANVMAENPENFNDSTNIFDDGSYIPSDKSEEELLYKLGRVYKLDSTMIVKFDIRTPEELQGKPYQDTLIVGNETFTRDLHNITESELKNLRYNLDMINNVKSNPDTSGNCSGKDCPVFARVSKNDQKLYLYINGEILDTFATSTGDKNHVTPNFNTKPNGRMYRKYTSKKFPGGNWNGLGNMPYAVFIQGGYAIHGTTSGNIKKLGAPLSHGCIRLDPRNAKIFYNLVNYAGANNTWIVVED